MDEGYDAGGVGEGVRGKERGGRREEEGERRKERGERREERGERREERGDAIFSKIAGNAHFISLLLTPYSSILYFKLRTL
ncbi:MAG: hypothetical protein JW915_21150 [Chitinispirillaceae bacterium]|nr:hypothetical protein [Chitinispirillaceae bacterium]